MNQRPIGYMDSGVGGLSVVKEALAQLPSESVIYFGDTARCPYGSRTEEEIEQYGREVAYYLLSKDIKALVIACNTVSSTSLLKELKKQLPIPVIGVIESGCQAALQASQNKQIALVGTEQTVRSAAHQKYLQSKDKNVQVDALACPDWVQLVESGDYHGEQAERIVHDSLAEFGNWEDDTLILACTHFPFLATVIEKQLPSTVQIIDPSAETIQELKRILDEKQLTAPVDSQAFHQLYTSGDAGHFAYFVREWLGEDYSVTHVSLGELAETSPKLLIATHNPGKAREYQSLFSEWGYRVETLLDYPDLPEVEETGTTFEENALLKAETLSQYLGQMVIADDSGLMVDALGGAPGIYSARYSGEPKDDQRNNRKLLQELENVPESERTAHFHTTIVAVAPGKKTLIVQGEVDGVILKAASGANGFGYDPLFYVPECGQTMAEMPAEQKNKISHRARAFEELKKKFPQWLANN